MIYDATFNKRGEFRDINQQDMSYPDVLECDSCKETKNLINTCVEFHKTTSINY